MTSANGNRSHAVRRLRLFLIAIVALLSGIALPVAAAPLVCLLGLPVAADIGDGVVMRSCVWEKAPGIRVRTGPLELHKNGVMILKTQTNADGQLHGLYEMWSDDGELQEKGDYVEGRKEGDWTETDQEGVRVRIRYRNGLAVEP